MALVLADRVRDTTTTTGTGAVTLSGSPPSGYQAFSKVGNGNTTYYTISGGGQWEVGIGTYTASTTSLSRDTVLDSSNSGSLVNFSAGTKDVFVTYPAGESVYQDGSAIKAGTAYLGVANGGTGQTSYTDGQLLIGNSTGNTLSKSTLTAGSGISVTNGSGTITIAATGGTGTVTSVSGSGGTTGLTLTGGPITSSGTLTLGGTLGVANGGTGATTFTANAILKGNGTSAVSASSITDNGTLVSIANPVTFASPNRSAAAWTTSGINLIQSAATFTDTSSTGTVADVRVNNFAAQTVAASNATTITNLYGTYFANPVAGTNVTATLWAVGADSIRTSGLQATGLVDFTAGSSTITFGGASSTGTITLGRSTGTQIVNVHSGTTASGSTKTVNIGTGGASGSTTNITLGSSTSGATQTTTVNGQVTLAPIGGSAAAWTTSGIALKQSAATWTDTSSTGTVTNVYMNSFGAQTLAASSPMTATYLYGTYFNTPTAGTNVTASNRFAVGADSIYSAGSILTSTSSFISSSTGTISANFAYGTTSSGNTKTVNIGTGGASGSTTNITIGSSTSGATSTTRLNGTTIIQQGAPVSFSVSGTITGANMATGFIQFTGSTGQTLTTDTGTNLDTALAAMAVDTAIDFSILNTGSGVTIAGGTGVTVVGRASVAANSAVLWRLRKTGTATYTLYQFAG